MKYRPFIKNLWKRLFRGAPRVIVAGRQTGKTKRIVNYLNTHPKTIGIIPCENMKQAYPKDLWGRLYSSRNKNVKGFYDFNIAIDEPDLMDLSVIDHLIGNNKIKIVVGTPACINTNSNLKYFAYMYGYEHIPLKNKKLVNNYKIMVNDDVFRKEVKAEFE